MASHRATAILHRPRALIIGFLLPALLLYGVFFVVPMIYVIWLSFQQSGITSEETTFVGAANYSRLINDPAFFSALWHNIQIVLIGGIATVVLALATAVALTKIKHGRDVFRVLFLFPNVMSVVAAAILWSFIFNPSFGIMNAALRGIGLPHWGRAWLNEPGTALPAVIAIHVWMAVGFYMVLFYAGLLRIPADYSEAARIDGATPWQEFRHISLPLLSEIMKIAVIYIIINSINVFALVFIINEGTASRYTRVLLTYMYEHAFNNNNYGYACAIGVATLAVTLVFSIIAARFFRRDPIEL